MNSLSVSKICEKSSGTMSMSQKAGLLKIQITSIMHRKFSKTLVLNLLVKESAIYVLFLIVMSLNLNMFVRKLSTGHQKQNLQSIKKHNRMLHTQSSAEEFSINTHIS